jgi:hypothetical protein
VALFLHYLPRVWEAASRDSASSITHQHVIHAFELTMMNIERPGIFANGIDAEGVDELMRDYGNGQDDSNNNTDSGDSGSELSSSDSIMYDITTDDDEGDEARRVGDDGGNGDGGGGDGDQGVSDGGERGGGDDQDETNRDEADEEGGGDEDDGNGDGVGELLVNFMPPELIDIPQELLQRDLEEHRLDIVHIVRQDDMVHFHVQFEMNAEVTQCIQKKFIEFMAWAVQNHSQHQNGAL